jgi:lipopolysaccharide transport system permease protein
MTQIPAGSDTVTHALPYVLPPLEEPSVRVVAPAKRRIKLRDLPGEAPVIRVIAARDFKVKYKQSLFGPLWVVFQPLALLLAFLVAFRGLGKVQSSNIPYAVFALAGLTAWSFFQAAMTIGTASIISNVNFVRYTPCPRAAFPLAAIIASLPSFAVTASGTIVAAAATGYLSARVFLLPIGLLWLVLLTAGTVGVTSSLAVRYRDVISLLPFLLQLGTFVAPVGYSLAALSPTLRTIVELNPLTGLMEVMRWILLSGYQPSGTPIAISLGLTVVLCVAGWRMFSRRETTVADEI